jgi:3-mercaptopyruvate sulfurtransferase SseA
MNRSLLMAFAFVAASAAGCKRSQQAAPQQSNAHAQAAEEAHLPELTVQQVADKMAHHENVAIFDANNRPRYERGHVPGARWVAFAAVTAADLPPDHDTQLVFYCANEH